MYVIQRILYIIDNRFTDTVCLILNNQEDSEDFGTRLADSDVIYAETWQTKSKCLLFYHLR